MRLGHLKPPTKFTGKSGCRKEIQSIIRSKTRLISMICELIGFFSSLIKDRTLTRGRLWGNLVVDNLYDSIKANSERSEDLSFLAERKLYEAQTRKYLSEVEAKQCTPETGTGKLPEVGNTIDSRQFAWNFFWSLT